MPVLYRKWRPSGKNDGKFAIVTGATCDAAPPVSDMRQIPLLGREKMITPSRFQEPPRDPAAGHSVRAGPPDASIVFSLSSAKKPMNRLSGDQKGGTFRVTPSV